MIAKARIAAYEILSAVSSGRADLPSAIAHTRASLPDERDRALAAEIATGVQRSRAALDHLIAHFTKRRLDKLDSEILEIIRLSIYQLLYLDRVPAAAVVDDAVNLAGRVGKRSAGGLVNAVLRTISRHRGALPLPPRPANPADPAEHDAAVDYLSITLSHPRWLIERWLDRLGFERAEAWTAFNNRPAPLTLRVNRLRTTTEDLQRELATAAVIVRAGAFAPDAWIVESGHPLRHAVGESGAFVVQDEASQLVTLLAGTDPGPAVLDTCASPGGKTTAFAAATTGYVFACDVRDGRIALLRRTIQAAGAGNVLVVQADVTRPLPFPSIFTTVIVDAPCSGLGTLRRDPDIRWRRQPADLAVLAQAQRRMLANAAAVVAPGGRLIYATCSSEPEENEQVVDDFLQHTAGFTAIDAHSVHPALPASVVDPQGRLHTSPDQHGLEAFFGAVFERTGDGAP
jgi:16S rRNA (cytosine967-C5)-methyltransferase